VLTSRIGVEYKIPVGFEPAPFETARWVTSGDEAALKKFMEQNRASMAEDRDDAPVFLARNAWELRRLTDDWPNLTFSATRERG
jgi:peptide chain release factor 3